MRNLYHYLLVLLLALAGCSTTAPQLSSYELQLLRGASTAADRIERIDEESIVVTNWHSPNSVDKYYCQNLNGRNANAKSQIHC